MIHIGRRCGIAHARVDRDYNSKPVKYRQTLLLPHLPELPRLVDVNQHAMLWGDGDDLRMGLAGNLGVHGCQSEPLRQQRHDNARLESGARWVTDERLCSTSCWNIANRRNWRTSRLSQSTLAVIRTSVLLTLFVHK